MAFTLLSASAAPNSLYHGSVRREAKALVESAEILEAFSDAQPIEPNQPATEQVQPAAPSEDAGGMAYDNYLNMLAAQRAFAESEFFGTTDQTLLIGGEAVRRML